MAHSRAAGSAALHTPTDLSADATSAVTEVLNPLVAVAPQRRGDDEPTRSFYRRDREAHLVSV